MLFSENHLIYLFLAILSVRMIISDIKYRILPDRLILAGIGLFFLAVIPAGDLAGPCRTVLLVSAVLTALMVTIPLFILTFVFEMIFKKEILGGGDLKLVFMMGLFFRIETDLNALVIFCAAGVLTVSGTPEEKHPVPLAPAVVFGFWSAALMSLF